MRDYAQLRPRFWSQGTGKQLRSDKDARLVALYLMSAPTSNMLGLYYLPIPTIAHELGFPSEGAREALARVCDTGFARYDEASEYVWVVNMAREQVGEVLKPLDNRISGIVKELEKHEKCPFFNDFLLAYSGPYCLDYSKLARSPSQGPCKPLRSQEQEQEQEQEKSASALAAVAAHLDSDSERFVSEVVPKPPRRADVAKAALSAAVKALASEHGHDAPPTASKSHMAAGALKVAALVSGGAEPQAAAERVATAAYRLLSSGKASSFGWALNDCVLSSSGGTRPQETFEQKRDRMVREVEEANRRAG